MQHRAGDALADSNMHNAARLQEPSLRLIHVPSLDRSPGTRLVGTKKVRALPLASAVPRLLSAYFCARFPTFWGNLLSPVPSNAFVQL
jgi:hypothetical protein